MMRRSDDETWLLNPRRRYILNADTTEDLAHYIETMSDLEGMAHYHPLRTAQSVRLQARRCSSSDTATGGSAICCSPPALSPT